MRKTATLILAFLLPPGASLLEAKTDYKRWLEEEVVWIISKKEKEAFKTLPSDAARGEFVSRFWQRRDPTPSTPRNEYKEEHYQRYGHALKKFQEGLPGWKSDRGRIYILHGPPDREYFHTSDSRLNVDKQTNDRSRIPNTIVWSYHEIPNGKYHRGALVLVFQPTSGISRQSFVLGESAVAQEKADELAKLFGPVADQTWLEADVRYRLIMAGPPSLVNPSGVDLPTSGLGELNRYLEDLYRSPGDILEERVERERLQEAAKTQLREAVTAQLSFGDLPLALSSESFRQADGDYRVQVQVDIPRDELSRRLQTSGTSRESTGLDLYCGLLDAQGRLADEFIDFLEVSPSILASLNSEALHYLNSFAVPAGDYTLKVAIRSAGTERLGFAEKPVALNRRGGPALSISEVMLTNQVQPVTGEMAPSHDAGAITVGDARLLPHPSRAFTPAESLVMYCQVFLPGGAELEDCELSIGANFIAEERIVKRLEPRRIGEANSALPGVVNFATAVPLADFLPGDYAVQVQVIEHASRKFAFGRATFQVLPAK